MVPLKVTEPIDHMPFNPTEKKFINTLANACPIDLIYCPEIRLFRETIVLMPSRLTIIDELWNPFEGVTKEYDFADVAEIS